MKTLFIVNPVAGKKSSLKIWNDIKGLIKSPFEYVLTKAPGEAVKLSRDASKNFDRIVAVGGDGTVCEVANGLIGSDVNMGIIPAGTGNDFIRTLRIPQDPRKALDVLEKGFPDYIDLGRYEGGFFINVAGIGLDAEVARYSNEDVKYLKGAPAYVFALMRTLFKFSPRNAVIEIDDKKLYCRLWLVTVANAKYYGGGMKICPDAEVDDGFLDICMVKEMSRLEILKFLPRVFAGGHRTHPAFEVIRGKKISIDFEVPTAVHADGDHIGYTPVKFEIVPKALKVIRNNFKRLGR